MNTDLIWEEVVSPIVDFLQTSLTCLVAPRTRVGPYRKFQRNISICTFSSYTPTSTALIRAIGNDPSAKSSVNRKHFLLKNAKGKRELLSVGSKFAIVAERMQGLEDRLVCL